GDHAGDTTSRAAHGDSSESDTSQPVLDRFELVDPACQVGDLGVEPGLELENVGAGRLVVELDVDRREFLPDLPEDVPQRIGDGRFAHRPTMSACQVAGPAMPSTTSPRLAWKSQTTWCVAGPKMPSTTSRCGPAA